jgi:hypothetical protein
LDGFAALLGGGLGFLGLAGGDDLSVAGLEPEPALAGTVFVDSEPACHRLTPARWLIHSVCVGGDSFDQPCRSQALDGRAGLATAGEDGGATAGLHHEAHIEQTKLPWKETAARIIVATMFIVTGQHVLAQLFAESGAARGTTAAAVVDRSTPTIPAAARNRTRRAVERTVPFGLICFSVITLWYALHGHAPDDVTGHRARARWYTTKTEPSYDDMAVKLRRVIIAARFRGPCPEQATPQETRAVLAAWAAADLINKTCETRGSVQDRPARLVIGDVYGLGQHPELRSQLRHIEFEALIVGSWPREPESRGDLGPVGLVAGSARPCGAGDERGVLPQQRQ